MLDDVLRDYPLNTRLATGAAAATVNRALALLRRAYNLGRKASPPKVARMLNFEMLADRTRAKAFRA